METQEYKNKRVIILFLYFYTLVFLFAASPAHAATTRTIDTTAIKIHTACFQKSECEGAQYNGQANPDHFCQIPSAQHSQTAINRQFIYNCYAKQPKVHLNVSIGGYNVEGLEQYLLRLYNYLVGIAGIVAGIMIVWAGVKWLTSAGMPDRITDAKKKIGNALIGIILVLGSYVILQTVNPALVELRLPPIKMVREVTEIKSAPCRPLRQFPCGGFPGREISNPGTWDGKSSANGQYTCSTYVTEYPQLCGETSAGECWGSYCASGQGGCREIILQRGLTAALNQLNALGGSTYTARYASQFEAQDTARLCVAPAECSTCENLAIFMNEAGTGLSEEGLRNALACMSAACDCFLTVNVANALQCIRRKGAGQDCRYDEECQSGMVCSTAQTRGAIVGAGVPGGKCFPRGGEGTACLRNEECAEGYFCAAQGVAVAGQLVGLEQSTGACVRWYSKSQGEPCASDGECLSRSCDLATTSQILSLGIGGNAFGTCR